MNVPAKVTQNPKQFLRWAIINHGDHENCEVVEKLEAIDETETPNEEQVAVLFAAVEETEGGDWEESFDSFLEDNPEPPKHFTNPPEQSGNYNSNLGNVYYDLKNNEFTQAGDEVEVEWWSNGGED